MIRRFLVWVCALLVVCGLISGCARKQPQPPVSKTDVVSPSIVSDSVVSETKIDESTPVVEPETNTSTPEIRNVVVKNPKMNQVTYEIDERLVGKYVANAEDMYFEIKLDGRVEISMAGGEGTEKFASPSVEIAAYYWKELAGEPVGYGTRLSFRLVSGDRQFPGGEISFELTGWGDTRYSAFELDNPYISGVSETVLFVKQ